MANSTQNKATFETSAGIGAQIPFEAICEAGCYVCNWNGHLLRVPEDGVANNQTLTVNIVGNEPLFVTRICENPYLPVTQAKVLASNMNLAVNF